MPTREVILRRLESGGSYEDVARDLGISAGKAYMIATGLPADGSDSLASEDYKRPGARFGGTQALLGVPHHNPTERERIDEFVQTRVQADAQMRRAGTSAKSTRKH